LSARIANSVFWSGSSISSALSQVIGDVRFGFAAGCAERLGLSDTISLDYEATPPMTFEVIPGVLHLQLHHPVAYGSPYL